MISKSGPKIQLVAVVACVLSIQVAIYQASCQLPDDIQRELNQNLAEQARIQAMRARHQQQIQAGGSNGYRNPQQQQVHDPNNYSYQQVSPPIQYSYYQPYGDVAQQHPAGGTASAAPGPSPQAPAAINIDLNNLNFDLPTPQAQVSDQQPPSQPRQQQHLTPSFTGAGGLPVMQPVAAANQATPGAFAPQAGVQQGPPLTEADFKDITGGENYGAPGGSDFGLGNGAAPSHNGGQAAGPRSGSDSTDAQLREFGLADVEPARRHNSHQQHQSGNPMQMGIPDFGAFGSQGGESGRLSGAGNNGGALDADPFGAAGGFGAPALGGRGSDGAPGANEFDFASQPSSAQGDHQGQAAVQGGAPGSLQSLLGNSFPGLAGGSGVNMGLDGLARGTGGAPEPHDPDGQGRADDGALDLADMGDRSDGFSGADLGGFEQPGPQNDQDFNYAAAAEQQPRSVPYPDAGLQPVGTLWALSQPQSLSQARYNALPDKGTYQDYPAYQSGGNDFGAVIAVVDGTPAARPAGPGSYAHPAPSELASEHRPASGQLYDYAQSPSASGDGAESASVTYHQLD